jgi:peptidoglycan/LPS O-acetylase OafA/YrhL
LLPASWFWMFVVLFFSAFYNVTNAFGEFRHNVIYCFTIITFSFNIFSGYLLEQGYLPTYGPYWSLSLEEQFYFVAPFILLFMRTGWKVTTLSLLAVFLLYIVQQGDWSPNFRYHGLIFGVLLAMLKLSLGSKIKPRILERWYLRYLVNIFLLFSLFAIPAALKGSVYLFGSLAMISTLLVYIASWDSGFFMSPGSEGIVSRSMSWIASRSYSIYLAHMPVIYFVQESTVRIMVHYGFAAGDSYMRSLWMTIAALGLIFVSSELSYRYLEVPLRNKGRNVARKYEVTA